MSEKLIRSGRNRVKESSGLASRRATAQMGMALAMLCLGLPVWAGNLVFTGAATPEPANHSSFVRDAGIPNGPGARGPNIVATDAQYAADLKNNVTAGSVDVLFQQCFGGGFLNDLIGAGPASVTGTAAARWNEPALNNDQIVAANKLDNYTRAWRDAASARSGKGFYDWYQSAVTGTGVFGGNVSKDPYAQVPEGANREHPMYGTADNPVGGANDTRTLLQNGAGPQQYAILVAWDVINTRHMLNLSREYWLLRNTFGVPADNIVVLNANASFGNFIPNLNFLDSAVSGQVFVDGNSKRETWLDALKGVKFSTNGTANGTNIPKAGDKLFIYNTGHGGEMLNGKVVAHNAGDAPDVLSGTFNLTGDGFATGYQLTDPEASSVMNNDGTVLFQLQLSHAVNPNALITLAGVASASAGSALVTDPTLIYNYNGLTDNAVTYQLSLPESLLSLDAASLDLSISGLQSQFVSDGLVLMSSFIGGDQELAFNQVPEPAVLALWTMVAFAAGLRRRR